MFFTRLQHWFSKLKNQLTVLFGGLVLVITVALTVHIGNLASQIITDERGKELTVLAKGLAANLGQTIYERMREVELLSKRNELVNADLSSDLVRNQLQQVKNNYPYYAWIGVADVDGVVQSDASSLLEEKSVAMRPWFAAGKTGNYVGDAHEAVLLAKALATGDTSEPLRFVDFAAPIYAKDGTLRGVVATHALWSWVSDVIRDFLPRSEDYQGTEILILNRFGQIIHPFSAIDEMQLPKQLPETGSYASLQWAGESYLTSLVNVNSKIEDGLGWQIVIRQPTDIALQAVAELQRSILIAGLVAVLLATLIAYRLANRFSQPIESLVDTANKIEEGEEGAPIPVNRDLYELRRLGESLQGMTETLLHRKQELYKSNLLLEQRVQQRTEELAEANQELERLLRHDPLTGILNRRAFSEALEDEFKRMKRHDEPFSVILLDVDYFKQVNDKHGHAVGDKVLEHLANTLQGSVRETDTVARQGGEEFVVLLPNTTEDAEVVAEKIRTAVADSKPPTIKQLTISAGIATATPADSSPDSVLSHADKAMYEAKKAGRNRVVRFRH